MRRFLFGVVVVFVLSFPVARMEARQYRYDVRPERRMLKAQQKQEWKSLKLQQKYQKKSWKGQGMSKAARVQAKHQMHRQKRELREKQRDDRQDLKDRQRMMLDGTKQARRPRPRSAKSYPLVPAN